MPSGRGCDEAIMLAFLAMGLPSNWACDNAYGREASLHMKKRAAGFLLL